MLLVGNFDTKRGEQWRISIATHLKLYFFLKQQQQKIVSG